MRFPEGTVAPRGRANIHGGYRVELPWKGVAVKDHSGEMRNYSHTECRLSLRIHWWRPEFAFRRRLFHVQVWEEWQTGQRKCGCIETSSHRSWTLWVSAFAFSTSVRLIELIRSHAHLEDFHFLEEAAGHICRNIASQHLRQILPLHSLLFGTASDPLCRRRWAFGCRRAAFHSRCSRKNTREPIRWNCCGSKN